MYFGFLIIYFLIGAVYTSITNALIEVGICRQHPILFWGGCVVFGFFIGLMAWKITYGW